ncbi:MAG: glycosyltransferase family 4 protein [Acidobacteria bacterium]|nr:glycosyltransferase family 4 protein [Acidobacteriota bacterium]
MSLTTPIACLLVFAATVVGVRYYRVWSLRRRVLDVPNERSSHFEPTPRGGGVVIFFASLSAYVVYGSAANGEIVWSFVVGSILIAAVSMIDDFRHVPVALRFSIHSAAAVLVIFETGGFAPFHSIVPPWASFALSFIWIVWFVNAYNFMDGIDGIAALQAITAGIAWAVFGHLAGAPVLSFFGIVLASASAGFLYHNWAPASIFMGDVGAAFLGFSFAVMPFLSAGEPSGGGSGWLESVILIPVWFFVFDSVFTFCKRLWRREKVWRAHREHIYQQLVIGGMPHRRVTVLYGILSATLAAAVGVTILLRGDFRFWYYVWALPGTCALMYLVSRFGRTIAVSRSQSDQ